MVGVALIVLGVVFLFVGGYYFLIKAPKSRAQFERRTGKTKGSISDVIVKEHKTKKKNRTGYYVTHTYKAECRYNVGGVEYKLRNIPCATKPEVGDEVDITYNPDDPQDAHVDQFTADPDTNKKAGLIIMVIAAIMCVIGIVIR